MKIGVISDTHENMIAIGKAVDLFNSEAVDLVCHAGDVISPITYNEFRRLECTFLGVFGNNDGEKDFLRERFAPIGTFHYEPFESVLPNRWKMLLMHRPILLEEAAASGRYDLIIYGHTHEVDVRDEEGATLVVNPGEACKWLKDKATVALIDTRAEAGRRVRIVDLGI